MWDWLKKRKKSGSKEDTVDSSEGSDSDMSKSHAELLNEAKQYIASQQEHIEHLSSPPWKIVTCIQVDPKEKLARFVYEGGLMEAPFGPKIKAKDIKVGYECRLNPQSGAVIEARPNKSPYGVICTVQKVHEDNLCEVELQGSTTSISYPEEIKVEQGDRVIVIGGMVVVKNLGKQDNRFLFAQETNVCWEDIGGLEDAKEQMIEAIELPHKHPDIYKKYNKRAVKGILLWGPPGCGKTMLGKASATSLATTYGAESASTGYIYVKGPELLNMYVGNTEASIRGLFAMAREHKLKNGYPAIIFIDEADALLMKRGSNRSHGVTDSSVNQFLAEMDGLEDSGAMILLATNRPDRLDPAVLREGRVDRKVKVERPGITVSADIMDIHLQDRPMKRGFTRAKCREVGIGALFSESRVLYEIETKEGETIPYTLGHSISGAMIAAMVDAASAIAINRDLRTGKFVGITSDDMLAAADLMHKQSAGVDNPDAVMDFVESFKDTVKGIRKVAA